MPKLYQEGTMALWTKTIVTTLHLILQGPAESQKRMEGVPT